MDRRELLQSAAALTIAAMAASVSAAEDHSHHDDHGSGSKFQGLIAATGDCVAKGQACLAHCLVLLADGDKTLADCSKAVNQMLALCGALQNLAAQSSKLTPGLAKAALDACTECEKECKKHKDKHAECKACRESCTECIKQCKAIAI
jgi:Cys-rich four helix bundle protein (predicted Tat secretion target)